MGGLATGRCGRHAQANRQAKHCAHRGIITLVSCDKAFQDPCHSETKEQKYVQQHIMICTHGVKTELGERASQDNRHSVPTHIPIPGATLSVAGRGGGSNTTHALLSPDPETLPIGKGVAPSHRRLPGNQAAPRPTDSSSPRSLSGRSQPPSEPGMRPHHYPLGVGS